MVVQAFNVAGKLVLEKLLPAGQLPDLAGLAPNIFVLKVAVGQQVFSGKFIKQ
jgi:hypothetical protein